jgi:hypothetical protein
VKIRLPPPEAGGVIRVSLRLPARPARLWRGEIRGLVFKIEQKPLN